jgi:hypothetical protein
VVFPQTKLLYNKNVSKTVVYNFVPAMQHIIDGIKTIIYEHRDKPSHALMQVSFPANRAHAHMNEILMCMSTPRGKLEKYAGIFFKLARCGHIHSE